MASCIKTTSSGKQGVVHAVTFQGKVVFRLGGKRYQNARAISEAVLVALLAGCEKDPIKHLGSLGCLDGIENLIQGAKLKQGASE